MAEKTKIDRVNVDITPELRTMCKTVAAATNRSLYQVIEDALEEVVVPQYKRITRREFHDLGGERG